MLAEVAARSERRWKAILNECDADGDESRWFCCNGSKTAYSHCSEG